MVSWRLLIGAFAGLVLGGSALAAGIDSRAVTCPALQSAIAQYGYVFIGNANFQDFVVADRSYCSGGDRVQVRSLPTIDRPECLVNYCIPTFDNRVD